LQPASLGATTAWKEPEEGVKTLVDTTLPAEERLVAIEATCHHIVAEGVTRLSQALTHFTDE
jgi:hypothetical protein